MKGFLLSLLFALSAQAVNTNDLNITVEIIEPVSGSVVSNSIFVTAVCSLNVVKVEFYRDGILFATRYKATAPENLHFQNLLMPIKPLNLNRNLLASR